MPLDQGGGHFPFTLGPFQNIPEALAPAVIEKYLGGTDDPVKNKDQFSELMADVVFGVPAVTLARGHRGESQRLDRKGHQPHPLRCLSVLPTPQHRYICATSCGSGLRGWFPVAWGGGTALF